jgi:hypothetical protein
MPRAIVYGRHKPGGGHYEALLAAQTEEPTKEKEEQLHAQAVELAKAAPPRAAQPHYLARIAGAPDALQSPEKEKWWTEATERAAAGEPAPPEAVAMADTAAEGSGSSTDGFLEKLAKYIPAESLTLTLLAFAALEPSGADIWWLVVGGALANVLYLYATALHSRKEVPMPRLFFYLLSAGALALWSIAVIEVVGKKAGIEGANAEAAKTFVLACAAFFIPVLDTILSALSEIAEENRVWQRIGAFLARIWRWITRRGVTATTRPATG